MACPSEAHSLHSILVPLLTAPTSKFCIIGNLLFAFISNLWLLLLPLEIFLSFIFFLPDTVLVFNWNHFETRLFNLRINFFIHCGLLVLILVVFVLFLISLCFGQISPLAFFG